MAATEGPNSPPEPEQIPPGIGLTPEERSYWFFQPIVRPETPALNAEQLKRVATRLMHFCSLKCRKDSRLPKKRSGNTDPASVFRSHWFATTLEDMERWKSEPSGDWYERLVEDLLQSPHYGERWARHWLDVAGYRIQMGTQSMTRSVHGHGSTVIMSFAQSTQTSRLISLSASSWQGMSSPVRFRVT